MDYYIHEFSVTKVSHELNIFFSESSPNAIVQIRLANRRAFDAKRDGIRAMYFVSFVHGNMTLIYSRLENKDSPPPPQPSYKDKDLAHFQKFGS